MRYLEFHKLQFPAAGGAEAERKAGQIETAPQSAQLGGTAPDPAVVVNFADASLTVEEASAMVSDTRQLPLGMFPDKELAFNLYLLRHAAAHYEGAVPRCSRHGLAEDKRGNMAAPWDPGPGRAAPVILGGDEAEQRRPRHHAGQHEGMQRQACW